MQLHQLKSRTHRKDSRPVGRGGKRGKTSGRGTKGQRARAGHRIRPEIRDVIKKLPKRRGRGKSSFKSLAPWTIMLNVSDLEAKFETGATVDKKTLVEVGLIRRKEAGSRIKLLGDGDLKKKLNLVGLNITTGAKKKVEEAGGTIK